MLKSKSNGVGTAYSQLSLIALKEAMYRIGKGFQPDGKVFFFEWQVHVLVEHIGGISSFIEQYKFPESYHVRHMCFDVNACKNRLDRFDLQQISVKRFDELCYIVGVADVMHDAKVSILRRLTRSKNSK